ncbi:MAG: hypothetical protein A4E73_01467 [Syntrophaceae bacterium PtaU1.Bin231]|nr:MAG: hypothetical protein A4E73_01467 [Syntrophaceae bacterium PtaU1.Bin231]HOG17541.1 hypothetical protein [Syntrophales bacterium]HOI15931.1 hypothetical protein [Geobacteraceae bacterium]
MKRSLLKTFVIAASLVVGLLFGQGAFAAAGPGGQVIGEGGNPGAWTLDMPVADLEGFRGNEPIDTFMGTVTSVGKMKGVKDGVQLTLKERGGSTYTVLLGPGWFINNQSLKFVAKDKIEVRGKRVGFNIVASEVSKGDWTMRLRNEADGTPEWQCCFLREKKM